VRLLPKHRDLNERLERIELRVDASALRLPVEDVHVRLDVFLASRLKWRSRSSIQNLIRDGFLHVDASSPEHPAGTGELKVERRPGRRLAHGSRVVIVIPEGARFTPLSAPSGELSVLYEDESTLVVDKPPFVAVHPSGRYLSDTLIQRVHAQYECHKLHRDARPRLCHRLDRETSGLVLIGKDPQAHAALMRQFELREVEKEYLAIVQGQPKSDGGRIDLPIGPSRVSQVELKMAVVPDGQAASTEWNVVSRHASCALLACRPFTGRQHQIRVHLEALGHPLVGDKLYGLDEELFQKHADGELDARDLRLLELPRHALHNHRLVFVSPRSGERVEVVSPLAPDLAEFLARR
jgi:23S rRNA pseudouridine1911/1915/1917 synthase